MRVVSTDKLAVQVLVAVMAGVAPPVEGLTVTNEVTLPGTVSSQSSLSTPDTFAGLVTNITVISPCLEFLSCLLTFCSSQDSWWTPR